MLPDQARPDVLHIVQHEKFVPALIRLIARQLQPQRHHFFFVHGGKSYVPEGGIKVTRDSDFRSWLIFYLRLIVDLNQAGKIVLHGLFSSRLIMILWIQPWLWPRCYWVIWGGDLYTYADKRGGWRWYVKEFFRQPLIRSFGKLVTYIPGDVDLARNWYGSKGEYRECLMYPSNTFTCQELVPVKNPQLTIQIGNSADPANCHNEILAALDGFKQSNILILAPLSYGDSDYADYVTQKGCELFGKKFRAMRTLLTPEDYHRHLSGIDVAIFAHRRQQGMGNMIALLGLGKKVIMRKETTAWMLFKALGFDVYSFDSFDLTAMPLDSAEKNRRLATIYFSEKKLVEQWRSILEES